MLVAWSAGGIGAVPGGRYGRLAAVTVGREGFLCCEIRAG
jgi:hypothetical protein